MYKEMEMPCPCEHCGEWFDLNDGRGSELWYPKTVICNDCYNLEAKEIELDEEIEEVESNISDEEITITDAQEEITQQKQNIVDAKEKLKRLRARLVELKKQKAEQ